MGLAAQGRAPQGAPQQQPAPNPMKASPMAGLGSVEDRVAAYRGNPAPLQQRYTMSQDLLDLLALQKIKSEKEAAARDMQLKMSQQAAAQGAETPTVAAQREKEVMELTKNELAQQRGETANQQVAQQQGMMQKLMGGIAAAPGAQAAAQPKMMATGGIVAFAEGGSSDKEETDEEKERKQREGDRAAMANTLRKLKAAGMDVLTLPGRGLAGAAESVITRPLRAMGVDVPYLPKEFYGGDASSMTPYMDKLRREEAEQAAPAPVQAGTPPMPGAAPAAPASAAPAPAAPRPPAPAGLAGMPGAQGAPSTAGRPTAPGAAPAAPGTPSDGLGSLLRTEAEKSMQIDPEAVERKRREEITKLMEFPEERARRQKYIEDQRRMMGEEFDPEKQRRRQMAEALMGAGGRRYGEFAGAAKAGLSYEDAQRAAKRERLKGIEDSEQGLFGLQKAAVEKGIAGGEKGYEQSSILKRQGMETGRGVYGTDVQSRDAALNREIDRMKVAASNEANRIQREGLNLSRAQTLYSTTMNRLQQLERNLDEDFAGANGMLIMAEQSGKIDPAQKKQLDIARLELQRQKAQIRKEMEPVLAPIRKQLGASSSAGMSTQDQALVDKYLNKGK
jgi:hypothetical protein